jgi:hypothetical protein
LKIWQKKNLVRPSFKTRLKLKKNNVIFLVNIKT